jgi:hypothetical protein
MSRYSPLVRFSFLILIGRFVTLSPWLVLASHACSLHWWRAAVDRGSSCGLPLPAGGPVLARSPAARPALPDWGSQISRRWRDRAATSAAAQERFTFP